MNKTEFIIFPLNQEFIIKDCYNSIRKTYNNKIIFFDKTTKKYDDYYENIAIVDYDFSKFIFTYNLIIYSQNTDEFSIKTNNTEILDFLKIYDKKDFFGVFNSYYIMTYDFLRKFTKYNTLFENFFENILKTLENDCALLKTFPVIKKYIPLMGILTLNRHDLLIRLINSIDYNIDTVVILFQEGYKNFDFQSIKNKFINNFIFVRSDFNIGVSRGWNYISKNYLKTYCIISGDDNYFSPGHLEKVYTFMSDNKKLDEIMFTFNRTISFSTFILTKKALEVVGYFDENIYPAYYEDNDYHYRIILSGYDCIQIPEVSINTGDENLTSSCTLHNIEGEYRHKMNICYGRNGNYYLTKWNNLNYKLAFNKYDIKTQVEHENYYENQKILLGHCNKPQFKTIEISSNDLFNFDYIYYKNNNKDLEKNGIDSERKLLYHYIEFGIDEKRECYENQIYNNFNHIEYISQYNLNNISKNEAFEHYRIHFKKDLLVFDNIVNIKYGLELNNSIDIKNCFLKQNNLLKYVDLNTLNGDPFPNIPKFLFVEYILDDKITIKKFEENRNVDILFRTFL